MRLFLPLRGKANPPPSPPFLYPGKNPTLITDSMFHNMQYMAKSLQDRSVGPAIRRWLGVFSLLRTRMEVEIRLEETGVSLEDGVVVPELH